MLESIVVIAVIVAFLLWLNKVERDRNAKVQEGRNAKNPRP